jgi:hypothetical protein
MQQKDMAEKRRLFVDGSELTGLVSVAEYKLEKGTIEVPEFDKIRVIQNGVRKLQPLEAVFKIQRNSQTLKKLWDWYDNNEIHDISMERTDAHGNTFETDMFPDCECNSVNLPAFDAANPIYAQINVRFIPWDIDHRSS